MRARFLHSMLLLLLIPTVSFAQEKSLRIDFYYGLGMKDATHELSMNNVDVDDELDFWFDQKQFEQLLKTKNTAHYKAYLNGKYQVYRKYQLLHGEGSFQSEALRKQMAFYLTQGNSIGTNEVVWENRTTRPKKN